MQKTFSVDKDFIMEAYNAACDSWRKKLREKFPSLFIKKVISDIYGHDEAISTPILYGGSVNFRNAGDITVPEGTNVEWSVITKNTVFVDFLFNGKSERFNNEGLRS